MTHSYDDLLQRSSELGAALQKQLGGDVRGKRVGILSQPGLDFVAAKWAVWRSGGCAVPLCVSHPKEELKYVLEDSGASALLVSESMREAAAVLDTPQISTSDGADGLHETHNAGADPAVLIYTSGTTGRPKGVVTLHSALAAQVNDQVEAWGWSKDDRILNCLPLHHVHGLVNLTAVPLSCGACIEFMEPKPERLWQRLRMSSMAGGQLTLFMAVPTIYSRMIAAYDDMPAEIQKRSAEGAQELRLMVSGSAALPSPVMERWKDITGHTLLERYGMTEFGMALSNPLEPVEDRLPGYVGRPMPSVSAKLVSEDTGAELDLESGEPGELCITGPNVFKEYWNKPEATAKEFDAQGWFKTGDIAAYDPEKRSFRILGRASADIIKSGGYKISALEIERRLLEHPDVAELAVLGVPDEEYGERVAAVVRMKAGRPALDAEAMRAFGKERLAAYKVPTRWLEVDDIPKNAMGKVSKKQLRADLF